jgi:flagellar basal-body rod protein FlgB
MNIGTSQTDKLLQGALTGLATRQRVITNNVANVDTPEFKGSRVDFEQALLNATGRVEGLRMASVPNAVAGPDDDRADLKPEVVTMSGTSRRSDGNNVDIDQEMVELAQTNLTYNAVTQLLNGRMAILRTVINGGSR